MKLMCDKMFVKVFGGVLALFGVISVIMAITVTTGSSWISDLMPASDESLGEGETSATASEDQFAADAASLGKLFEALIYVFGIYMLVMGMSAWCCCAGKYKGNCICVLLFLIFQIILMAVTIVIATLPFTIWAIDQEDIDWFCDNDVQQIENDLILSSSSYDMIIVEGKNYVDQVDAIIGQREAIMCTSQCPCDIENFDLWGEDFDDTDLVADAANGVDDWAECALLLGAESNDIQNYFDGLLEILEEQFDCQGICTPGNFWLFKDVDDGPVENACLKSLKEDFAGPAMAAVIVLFITIVIDLALFICMFGMFKSDDKE